MRYNERIAATPHVDGRAGLRARAVLDAAEALAANGNRVAGSTPDGRTFEWERIEREGTTGIRVYPVGGAPDGDAYVTIISPPILVPDPAGDIIVGGKPHREDPLTALAQVWATHFAAPQMEAPPWR